MTNTIQFPWQQEAIIRHSQRLMHSYKHWTGKSLLDVSGTPEEIAQALFEAPFVLASHGMEPDPILNYGNRMALQLWELSWEEFTRIPSCKAADEAVQDERNGQLAQTTTKGFHNFPAIRITSTGKRFQIEQVTMWNILDDQNQQCGQAALFYKWKFI